MEVGGREGVGGCCGGAVVVFVEFEEGEERAVVALADCGVDAFLEGGAGEGEGGFVGWGWVGVRAVAGEAEEFEELGVWGVEDEAVAFLCFWGCN